MSNGRNLFYCISLLFKATGEAVLPMVLSREKSFLNGTLLRQTRYLRYQTI